MSDPIVVQLVDAVVASVQRHTIDLVDPTDPARADVIKLGHLYQLNPTRPESNIYATISHGDKEDPRFTDGIVDAKSMYGAGFDVPVREIGGPTMWWRRFTAQYGVFLPRSGLTEREAMVIAFTFYERLLRGIEEAYVVGLRSGNETAVSVHLIDTTMYESGGTHDQTFIWRGKARFRVLTERSPQ